MSNASNVSAAKPKVEGGIWIAPLGTTLPKNATEALNESFKTLGYVSEDGMTNENNSDSEDIKEWGGTTVLKISTEKTDNFKFKLIETLNVEVLKFVYGQKNVSGTIDTGIKIKANGDFIDPCAMVIEMIMNGGILKRIVIPRAQLSELSEVEYVNNDAIGYEVTVAALSHTDSDGQYKHLEFISKPTQSL